MFPFETLKKTDHSKRFGDKNSDMKMYTARHYPKINVTRVESMIAEKLRDKPYFPTYDTPAVIAKIDNRSPYTDWYLGRYTDAVPTAHERDAGVLPRRRP